MFKMREGKQSLIVVITAVLFTLLLFAHIAAYFWAHKPFDLEFLSGLGGTIINITIWLGLLWVAAALGHLVTGYWLLVVDTFPLGARLAINIGLGLGLLSLLMLGQGVAGLLQPLVAWGLILGLGLLLRRQLAAVYHQFLMIQMPKPQSRFEWWLAVYAIVQLAFAFVLALAPETAWDALVYHLTGPELFVAAGRIEHLVDIPYLGFPQLAEMLFTLGLLLVGDGAASLLHFGYGLLGIVIAAVLAKELFGREAGWLTAVLLLTVPRMLGLMSNAYVDLTLLFYATAAFYLFYRWQTCLCLGFPAGKANMISLVLVGVFCGFALGVKYTAVAVPVGIAFNVAWTLRREPLAQQVRQLGLLTAVTTFVALPWLLENWSTTGNPVYPFVAHDGVYWDAWRASWFDRAGTGLLATAPWRLLTAPLEATVLGTTGSEAFAATIGPFILGLLFFLPLVWFVLQPSEKKQVGQLLLFLAPNYGLWLWGLARSSLLLQTRLFLPLFGITAVLGSLIFIRIRSLNSPALNVGWLSRVAFSLTLGLLLLDQTGQFIREQPIRFIMGQETRTAYLQRQLGIYQVAMDVVNGLPAESNVLFLWEPRSYGCRVTCVPDALLDRFLHHTQAEGLDAEGITAVWQQRGVTHVLLHEAGLQFIYAGRNDGITEQDFAIWQEIAQNRLEIVETWPSAYTLYRLPNS